MPGNLKKLIRPTGFEGEQQRAAEREKLADVMLARSSDMSGFVSPLQALASIAEAFSAHHLQSQSDKLTEDVYDKMSKAYAGADSQFFADAKTLTPQQMIEKYSGNPYEQDNLKPYIESYTKGMDKSAENANTIVHTPTGYKPLASVTGVPEYNPQAKMIPDGKGGYMINPALITADRASQANGPAFYGQTSINPSNPTPLTFAPTAAPTAAPAGATPFNPAGIAKAESGGKDFNPDGSPVTSSAGAQYKMQVMPSTATKPGFGVAPVPPNIMNLPATDPRRAAAFDDLGARYATAMRSRYGGDTTKAAAAYNGGPGRLDTALAARGANYLTGMPTQTQAYAGQFSPSARPPDGVTTDGRPYWMVNGTPYDNPDGN